jgi:hypothetical protein
MLFAFSSHQIVSFFPTIYESSKDILYGNTDITALLESVTESVFNAVLTPDVNENITNLFDNNFAAFNGDMPMLQTFVPPAKEHEVEFLTILFIIEHVFLILFFFLRNILSKR